MSKPPFDPDQDASPEADSNSTDSNSTDSNSTEALDQTLELDLDSDENQDQELSQNTEAMAYTEESLFLTEETQELEGFLPEASEEEENDEDEEAAANPDLALEGTELEGFESESIEEVHFVEDERLESIIESVLFASDRPVSLASLKLIFKGTNIKGDRIRRALDRIAVDYAGSRRGVTLEEVPGGYQLRTKIDNLEFLRGNLKARVFKLSGPALEVLSIVAYKQPVIKSEIDQIRGVESGHLLRALMEKGLANFVGKSDFPGRPMLYGTTKKFLEIFGLRNLKELPTLSQIDELLPEGIGEEETPEKPLLSDVTESLASSIGDSYSQGEDELEKIQVQLEEISTSSEFFEQEKERQKKKKEEEKAQNIREALAVGEAVSNRDLNWLTKFDEALMVGAEFTSAPEDSAGNSAGDSEGDNLEASSQDQGRDDEEAEHAEDEIPFFGEADAVDEDEHEDEGGEDEPPLNEL
jgi:segregation and condensation protein B